MDHINKAQTINRLNLLSEHLTSAPTV
jgi:alkylation response protein AidB-like acyl-CoA dehydrogenase